MGIFNRLFKSRSRTPGKVSGKRLRELEKLKPQAVPMKADKYWLIIGRSLRKTKSMEDQRLKLVKLLGKLKCEEIIGFHLRTEQLLKDSHHEDLLCAAHLIEGGVYENAFEFFRCWLISRGQQVFKKALQNPDSLIAVLDDVEDHSFEAFYHIPEEVFMQATGKSMNDFIAAQIKDAGIEELHLSWSPNNPDSMRHICPELFRKYAMQDSRW